MYNNWNLPLLINYQKYNTCTLGFVIAAWLHPINRGLSLWERENGQLPSEAGSECQCKNQGKIYTHFPSRQLNSSCQGYNKDTRQQLQVAF